jgi:hypothetical protein
MLGQRASSHTVCRFRSRSLALISVYLSPPGTARFSQSGLRAFSCRVGLKGQLCHVPTGERGWQEGRQLTFQLGACTE